MSEINSERAPADHQQHAEAHTPVSNSRLIISLNHNKPLV
jgi:hypothetical protein